MYRIYDKAEAIRSVQRYLRVAGKPEILIIPSGVYDENTRLSVLDFQSDNNLLPTGIVDYETFRILYNRYLLLKQSIELNESLDSFVRFPLYPGEMNDWMIHINRMMRNILNYYGFTNRLTDSNFYSDETAKAVGTLEEIYLLDSKGVIDEELYLRMVKDHDSIGLFDSYFL